MALFYDMVNPATGHHMSVNENYMAQYEKQGYVSTGRIMGEMGGNGVVNLNRQSQDTFSVPSVSSSAISSVVADASEIEGFIKYGLVGIAIVAIIGFLRG